MPRDNGTAWIVGKGVDFLSRLYTMKGAGFDRSGDCAAADALTTIALLEGRGAVTGPMVGKARCELGLVAYRSKRAAIPPPTEPQTPAAQLRILPAPEPAPTVPDLALLSRLERESVSRDERIAAALEKIASHLDQIEAVAWAREMRERGAPTAKADTFQRHAEEGTGSRILEHRPAETKGGEA